MSPEKEEEIAKNLSKYSRKYEAEDQDISMLLSEQGREKRKMLEEEWEQWLGEWKQCHEEEKLERQKLLDEEEEDYEDKETEIEELVDVSQHLVPFV